MATNILSPLSIWGDLVIQKTINSTTIFERKERGVLIESLFIDGRTTENGQVKIFLTICKKEDVSKAPAILMIKEFEKKDVLQSLIELANDGYIACTVDIEGKIDGKDYFTFYPDDINYAEYYFAKDNLYKISEDAKKSCWYEWGCVIRYAISFINGLDYVGKIGVIGSGVSATALYQAVAKNKDVSAFVALFNGGWHSYKGFYKFDDNNEAQLSDDELMFIAGVEPQSYAQHIDCPTFIVSNPTDVEFEGDRVHDTLKRVNNEQKGIMYENACQRGLSNFSVDSVKFFFANFLNSAKGKVVEPNISSKIENGEIVVEIAPTISGLNDICLYCAEEMIATNKRVYIATKDYKKKDNVFIFKYHPYFLSKRAFFFATCHYENGLSISTNIENVTFNEKDIAENLPTPIIYSSRIIGSENVFLSKDAIEYADMFCCEKDVLKIKDSTESIKGLLIRGGIITHSIEMLKYRPKENSLILVDFFSKTDSQVVVKVYTNNGDKVECFSQTFMINGSKAWQNYKIESPKLKNDEGISLKNMSLISSIEFYSESDVLINNLLWV